MIKLIVKCFVKNNENLSNPETREKYGILGGVLGTICNFILFALKLTVGLFIHSIAVISDAFNNLSDFGSSIISIIGAKMGAKSADEEHPYGHGRAEYISALIIAFLIMLFGVELLKTSVVQLYNPQSIELNIITVLLLISSVLVKLWMWSYNKYLAGKINSSVLYAAAKDSMNDVVATSIVIVGAIASNYVTFPVDGVIGVCVSVLIIRTGIGVAKETIGSLLGKAPSNEIIAKIEMIILEEKLISGVHDLMIHDYGPGRTIASVHAEVPDDLSIVEVHNVIDKIEHRILNELEVDIVIHMDPVKTNN